MGINDDLTLINDVKKHMKTLIEIPSHRDLSSKSEGKPFGEGIAKAFDALSIMGKELGFIVHHEDGYAMDLRTGHGEEYIGVLCHIDTVEAIEMEKWDTNPYELVEKAGILYGRGVNDNKGPLIGAMHAIKQVMDSIVEDDHYPIRLIVGGAEETTWQCMERYFSHNPQPLWAFSPDGDFPIVQGEKGILQVRLTFGAKDQTDFKDLKIQSKDEYGFICDEIKLAFKDKESEVFYGKRALSRHPERGVNAVLPLIKYLNKQDLVSSSPNSRLGQMIHFIKTTLYSPEEDPFIIKEMDQVMGESSVSLTKFHYEPGHGVLDLDFRYTRIHRDDSLFKQVKNVAKSFGATVTILKEKDLLFVSEGSPLIRSLVQAYENVMGEEATLITKGGASYARVLERGVAFGPTFPGEVPNSHLENEKMSLDSLLTAMEIYKEALLALVKKK